MDSFIKEIDDFCARHGMSEREFGRRAINDTSLVLSLKGRRADGKRRRPRLDTYQRIRDFMEQADAAARAAAEEDGHPAGAAAE